MKARLTVDGSAPLRTRDGTVIGEIETVTVNFDVRAVAALCGQIGGTIGVGVDVEPSKDQRQDPCSPSGADDQGSLLPDPVNGTWAVYVEALDRPKAMLTPKVRKWIADAHKAVGVEATRDAIRGLGGSEYHREKGYVGIEYAIVPKRGETIEGRIEKMVARRRYEAPANDTMTVDQLVERFPEEHRQRVRDDILKPIVRSLINKHDTEAVDEGARQLRQLESFGYELIIEGERVTGARRK
jgi:hypothetical protein